MTVVHFVNLQTAVGGPSGHIVSCLSEVYFEFSFIILADYIIALPPHRSISFQTQLRPYCIGVVWASHQKYSSQNYFHTA